MLPTTALVTGASGAFGSATCRVLRERGVTVVGLDRVESDDVIACDVTDSDQVRHAVGRAIDVLGGRLDLLVNYAGIGCPVDAGELPGDDVQEIIDVNLLGAWRVTAAAMPALVESGGRVIFVSSLLAGFPLPFASAYAVSKKALVAYADALRLEYGMCIGVTTVYPGYVRTPIHDRSREVGVSLDGIGRKETVGQVVAAVVRAATAKKPYRELTVSRFGRLLFGLSRHAPVLVERHLAKGLRRQANSGQFWTAPIAQGMRERYAARPVSDPERTEPSP